MKQEKLINEAAPYINVTPLIDVLLVLLIIFMVISPLKPSRFEAKVPAEPKNERGIQPPVHTLVVTIKNDLSLMLNGIDGLGSVSDPSKLSAKLVQIFQERKTNRVYEDSLKSATYLSEDERVLKTVYIKAPRFVRYGEIAKVIDSLKGTGAAPIGLQIDNLN